MKPQPNETIIKGNWLTEDNVVRSDANCERISWLVAQHLIQMGKTNGGWDTLFKDPDDGRYWEHIYPQSELHGGGPPELRLLTKNEVIIKYGEGNLIL